MIDVQSFVLSLPSFLEKSYFISPGIVSVVFKIIWSIFTFLIITFVVRYGLAGIGLYGSQTTNKSLWNSHREFSQVQSISNGRWGEMFFNLPSIRVILGVLFWISMYACELLFSLSIDNAYITHYNGTNCVGRIDDYKLMANSMWDESSVYEQSGALIANSTLLRQLTNQRQVGNFALLGDGLFTISPVNALYSKGQVINVSRAGLNCTETIPFKRTAKGLIYRSPDGNSMVLGNISTEHFSNISIAPLSTIEYAYINLNVTSTNYTADDINHPDSNFEAHFLLEIGNPLGLRDNDINVATYNNSVFISDCTLFYEQGHVTVDKEGYLNETNVADSFVPVFNQTLYDEYRNASLTRHFHITRNFLAVYVYPDQFLNAKYNKTYIETLKTVNDIIAAHFVNGLDPFADPCTFNQEQVPVYISVLGTRMSFGYIIVGVAFAVLSIFILTAFAFVMFSEKDRREWQLYSYSWRYVGYVDSGENMDEKAFKKYAKETYINNAPIPKDVFQVPNDERFHSDISLRKEEEEVVVVE